MKRAQLGKNHGLSGATKMALCNLPPSYPPFKKAPMQPYSRAECEPDIERMKQNTHIGLSALYK